MNRIPLRTIKRFFKLTFVSIAYLLFFTHMLYPQIKAGEQYILTEDGAWCWFQDPRAIYLEGKFERIYTQWITHDGNLQVGAINLSTGKQEVFTIKENWDADDHNVGAFIALPDNRIMVFYARHNQQGLFCRTTSQPEDIMSWNDEVTISDSPRITYAHPVYLSMEEKFYVFWRGPSWKPTFATSRDGINWTEPQILLQDSAREDSRIRPYIKITSDGKSSIHLTFTDGHPNVEPQNSLYYLKYEKGKFYKADGSIVGSVKELPIRHSISDIVYDAKASNVRAWVWDIALDKKGYPVIAYTQFPEETDHRYHFARWNGENWDDKEIADAGRWFPQTPEGVDERETYYSGGIVLNPTNPNILYLSGQVDGMFEIERWESKDDGKTWTSIYVTSNSRHLNVRPVFPFGLPQGTEYILWMFGDYEHYTNFRTGIKLIRLKE